MIHKHLLGVAAVGAALTFAVGTYAWGVNTARREPRTITTEVKVVTLPTAMPSPAALPAPSPTVSADESVQVEPVIGGHAYGVYNGRWLPILVDQFGHVRVKLDESDRQYIIQALRR